MADQNVTIPPIYSRSPNGTPLYRRICPICGEVAIVDKRRLRNRCRRCTAQDRVTHGLTRNGRWHPLYRVLNGLVVRCTYPSATNFAYYGGRGIKVCEEWTTNPQAFVTWALANGWQPGLEIDRKDVNGNYSSDNCHVISHRLNSQRTRRIHTTPAQVATVKRLLLDGISIRAAAATAGVTYMVAWHIKNSPGVWANIDPAA